MKKGVTPIVAILFLLMITVAIAGAVYSWISSTQSSLQQSAGEKIEETGERIGTRFSISEASCKEGEDFDIVRVRITNTGTNKIESGTSLLAELVYRGSSIGNRVIDLKKGLSMDETSSTLTFNFTGNPTNHTNKEHALILNLGSLTRTTTINCTL